MDPTYVELYLDDGLKREGFIVFKLYWSQKLSLGVVIFNNNKIFSNKKVKENFKLIIDTKTCISFYSIRL